MCHKPTTQYRLTTYNFIATTFFCFNWAYSIYHHPKQYQIKEEKDFVTLKRILDKCLQLGQNNPLIPGSISAKNYYLNGLWYHKTWLKMLLGILWMCAINLGMTETCLNYILIIYSTRNPMTQSQEMQDLLIKLSYRWIVYLKLLWMLLSFDVVC